MVLIKLYVARNEQIEEAVMVVVSPRRSGRPAAERDARFLRDIRECTVMIVVVEPDIYVSNFGKNRLYHNNHDGTFTDVAEKAGVTLGGWSTGATWGDYDHDGLLDLFVPGYVKFDPDHPPVSGKGGLPPGFCQFRGIDVMCGPRGLPAESDHLFHNNGDGTFTDVSVRAGVSDPRGYYGLASA